MHIDEIFNIQMNLSEVQLSDSSARIVFIAFTLRVRASVQFVSLLANFYSQMFYKKYKIENLPTAKTI